MPRIGDLFIAVARGRLSEIRQLLDAGCNVNAVRSGETALYIAILCGQPAAAKLLIERGADIDVHEGHLENCSPLMQACSKGRKTGEVVSLLLIEHGCDVHYRNSYGISALEMAVRGSSPELVDLLLEEGLPVNGPKGCRASPAILAADSGKLENLKVLVRHGCDLALKDKRRPNYGMTCLDLAVLGKHWKIVKYLRSLGPGVAPESEEVRELRKKERANMTICKKKVAKKKVAKKKVAKKKVAKKKVAKKKVAKKKVAKKKVAKKKVAKKKVAKKKVAKKKRV